ncbi:MAG: hypothetical protein VW644_14475 [Alphaproteobacteria bacterium]
MPLIAVSVAMVGRENGFAAFFPVYAALSIVAAMAIHFAVEKPFLILKGRL